MLICVIFLWSCHNSTPESETGKLNMPVNQEQNLLAKMSVEDFNGFQWMNEPEEYKFADNFLHIISDKGSDFFNNPENKEITASAPFLYTEMPGDFIATALVKPDFSDTWNAGALMVHINSANWIKFAFENSDATGKSIVTVVTREISDDANGVILNDYDSIWLKIIKKGNLYAMHWSGDGREYYMARLTTLPAVQNVKIGIEAQCPVGNPATHEFLFFSLEEKTVDDLRRGE